MQRKQLLILLLFSALLAACSSAGGPEQIAVHLQDEPIAVYKYPPENTVRYNATLDMEVSSVDRAAERAKEIAFEQGGYLVSAQTWYRDGERHTTVVLAVPDYRFDSAREDLLRLGSLVGEWISSELVTYSGGPREPFAQITVYLHPRESIMPELSLPKWRPVRTFEKAWSVFISLFGFLLDIVIWLMVVAGPFLLLGWGALRFYRWRINPPEKQNPDPES